MKEWMNNGRPLQTGTDSRGAYGNCPEIVLCFELEESKSLEDIRVEITDLVFRTFALDPETTIWIHKRNGSETSTEKAVRTLYRLRRALLVFFSDILLENLHNQDTPCPRIWADGKLRLREAELDLEDGRTMTLTNTKYKLGMAKMNKEKEIARRRIAPGEFDPTWGQCRLGQEQPASDTYETFRSSAKFLARFVQQSKHPEDVRSGRSQTDSAAISWCCAPWGALRELRPR